jgi:hypothetical protein
MSELDALPADQRAVLALLLKQGKTYAELSTLLVIDASAVRARAHAALDALGPDAGRQLTDERRGQVADYLLSQQTGPEGQATGEYLAGSAAARAWGRGVSGALRPLAAEPLPGIPEEAAAQPAVEQAAAPAAAESAPAAADAALSAPGPTGTARPRSSRLGGALLLGGLGVLVAVALVLILSSGGGSKHKAGTAASTAKQSTSGPSPVAQINLTPAGGGKSVGLAQVFAQGNQRLLIVAAQSLIPGSYALWLFNTPSNSRLLGFVPQKVDKQGRFVTQGVLPPDARTFGELVVAREQAARGRVPTQPGMIVLRGKLQTG